MPLALDHAVTALKALHRQGLVHGDAHPGNIFYDPGEFASCKIWWSFCVICPSCWGPQRHTASKICVCCTSCRSKAGMHNRLREKPRCCSALKSMSRRAGEFFHRYRPRMVWTYAAWLACLLVDVWDMQGFGIPRHLFEQSILFQVHCVHMLASSPIIAAGHFF